MVGPRVGQAHVAAGLHLEDRAAALGGFEAAEGEAEVGSVASGRRQFVKRVFGRIGRA